MVHLQSCPVEEGNEMFKALAYEEREERRRRKPLEVQPTGFKRNVQSSYGKEEEEEKRSFDKNEEEAS